MVYELGISLYPSRKNWMTEAFEHFLSGFIFSVGIHRRLSTSLPAWLLSHSKLYFWQAARHYSMAVQFWQVVVNAVNKHTKTDRFVRRLDIPQRLPSNNGKNEALIQQHLIFWYQTQILNDSNVWYRVVFRCLYQTLCFQDLQDCFALCYQPYQPLLREEELQTWGVTFAWILVICRKLQDGFVWK